MREKKRELEKEAKAKRRQERRAQAQDQEDQEKDRMEADESEDQIIDSVDRPETTEKTQGKTYRGLFEDIQKKVQEDLQKVQIYFVYVVLPNRMFICTRNEMDIVENAGGKYLFSINRETFRSEFNSVKFKYVSMSEIHALQKRSNFFLKNLLNSLQIKYTSKEKPPLILSENFELVTSSQDSEDITTHGIGGLYDINCTNIDSFLDIFKEGIQEENKDPENKMDEGSIDQQKDSES